MKESSPLLICGPCSAESEIQLINTAKEISNIGYVHAFRAGIWKPRTRPNSFEGIGEEALTWMENVKKETGLLLATEVANTKHVELCLKHNIDILWIGARTSGNPFSVQEIAEALKGSDVTVMVKNPIQPDIPVWLGAIERIYNVGLEKVVAVHRGFSAAKNSPFRNDPLWEIPFELKTEFPDLKIICDPSHISGNRKLIPMLSQKAMDLDMDGLLVESHIQPKNAWSDSFQQLSPKELDLMLNNLILRKPYSVNKQLKTEIGKLRDSIDEIDDKILQLLFSRTKVERQIGKYKSEHSLSEFQKGRWEKVLQNRIMLGTVMGMKEEFVKDLFNLIHEESIEIQKEVLDI
ncbi:MAG: bifunctional 3-deoxy-7-phosphoheptulonate synthase/chorismate mutase type II [Deltaproteobacteria bacterium]|nr:bifunctional 3-deoxy-7-phosphoheptulonate synthase/chorismate mutase type II [Deltaproteobacteria bacterium]